VVDGDDTVIREQPASDDGDGGDAVVDGVVQLRAEPFVGLGEVVVRGGGLTRWVL
jgi:hypothetical protein